MMKIKDLDREDREDVATQYLKLSEEEFKEFCEDSCLDYKDAVKYSKRRQTLWENY